ncbi:MAG: M23 family metallopeptidase [Deltaproteobacteria bacterium]|nr:M23 family metallopeptidase [Candidatus Zymogenaceae bacterium]
MIKKTYYSILIIYDKADRLSKYKVSNITLAITGFSALLILIAFSYMLYSYLTIRLEMLELSYYKEENRMQHDQIEIFEKQFKDLTAKVEQMSETNTMICAMLNIGSTGGESELFGIGGTSNGDRDLEKKDHDDEVSAAKILADMMQLGEKSKRQEQSLQELLIFLEDQGNLLDSTPSIWPAKGFLCSCFGFRRDPINRTIKMHEGYDIANKIGTPIHASADGIVIFAGIESGYGNLISVDHGYGISTNYAHLSAILVHEGDRVSRGQKIGLMGSTGRSIGSHLHYEVRINRIPVDPSNYILN